MSSEIGTVGKILDKANGALEKWSELPTLILVLSALLYTDIWLIRANIDPAVITIEDVWEKLRQTSILNLVAFLLSYSLLMAAVIPSLRCIYTSLWEIRWPGDVERARGHEARRLSNWSAGMVIFAIWNFGEGLWRPHPYYKGVAWYLSNFLSGDGSSAMIFRVSIIFFLLYCTGLALRRDAVTDLN
jgi:hypothetical protein